MGLFNKQSKEEKTEDQRKKFQEKFGLEDLEEKDLKILDTIIVDMAGTGGLFGQFQTITFNAADMQKVNASWTVVRQNWLLLRQLNRINQKLDKLIKKQGEK